MISTNVFLYDFNSMASRTSLKMLLLTENTTRLRQNLDSLYNVVCWYQLLLLQSASMALKNIKLNSKQHNTYASVLEWSLLALLWSLLAFLWSLLAFLSSLLAPLWFCFTSMCRSVPGCYFSVSWEKHFLRGPV